MSRPPATLPVVAAVVQEDAGGTLRLVTAGAPGLLGLAADAATFRKRHIAHWHRAVADRCLDPDGYLAGIDRLRRNGATVTRERMALADGSLLERSFLPLDGVGGALWLFHRAADVGEAQAARDRLAMYDAMLQALPAQIALFSTSARYEYVSPSAIRNEALRAWVIGRTDREYVAHRQRPAAIGERREQAILAVVASGEPQEFEEVLEGADGSIRYFRRYDVPIFDAQGTVTRVLGYGIDVTAQREVERQLQQAQKMDALGRLAGGVAHDFNNLLTVIGGCGEALRQELPPDDPRRSLIDPIIEAGERAAELTRQLLAFSRRSVGTQQAVEIGGLVNRTAGMLRRLIGEGVSIEIDAPSEPLHVRLDPSQLQQVLMNLAVNARDAMPEGGTLTLGMRRTEVVRPDIDLGSQQHVELEVRDSGHGMPDDVRRQVFEPFFTTKPVGQGTGLGLSTVYGIVSNAGGSITVESTEGVGTTFRVLLPLVDAEGATVEPVSGHEAPRGAGTILVVDDAPLVRGLVQRQLAKLGYTILTACDGVDALEVARAHDGPIDLMVSDVVMPRMGGPALARTLRESRPDVPVLFMSGYANDASLLQVMEEIGSGFLEKPFAVTALAERVASLLRVS